MKELVRRPLTYLVLGECCVLVALGVAVWHLVPHATPRAQAALTPAQPEPAAQPSEEPLPAIPTPLASPKGAATTTAGAGPGAGTPAFWADRLSSLNHDQAELQRTQWRLIDAALGAARRYLDEVVVPAVERAQRDHQPRAQSNAA